MEIIVNEDDQLTTLLIVDDVAEIRKLLRLTFSYGKYLILEAQNGIEALDIILREKPDIILLDIMMPGSISGLDVCYFVKSSTLKDCQVILLTAKGQQEDFQKGLEAGADIYMTKPFSPIALIDRVENIKKQLFIPSHSTHSVAS
jgi:two-component system phosphate regulon response regulator PhoB